MQGKASTGNRVAVISQEDYYETPVSPNSWPKRQTVEIFHKSVHLGFEIARYSIAWSGPHGELRRKDPSEPDSQGSSADGFDLVSSVGAKTYRMDGFDSIVLVYGSVPQSDLYDQLKARGRPRSSTSPVRPGCRAIWRRRRGMGPTSGW